ncbi:MAG: type II secretion system protein [Selenomonadaceae bacterium]|nr:type II secretion system protein [Selenomonadaceae bacterium]
MQKGFATLEIILFTLIIAVLATATLPNAARVIDRVSLDYETKRFYTNLKFLQAFDRMTNMKDAHFGTNDESSVISLEIPNDNKTTYFFKNRNSSNEPYQEYFLPKGFMFYYDGTDDFSYIKFDDMGKARGITTVQNPKGAALNGHIRINSQLNKDSYIVFNSIGRIRGSRVRPNEQNR